MKIHSITLTADELLDWINTLSSEKKKHVLKCLNEAKKDGGGLLCDGIEITGNLLCFSVLIYCGRNPHATKALSFQAPNTQQGRTDLESALQNIYDATGGFFK